MVLAERTSASGLIMIQNEGQDVESTNYFDTPHALRGLFLCSLNAGALRVLVPDALLHALPDMQTAQLVVITRGMSQGQDAVEIMFDDLSQAPLSLTVSIEQFDRVPSTEDIGSSVVVSAWGRAGKLGQWPGRYRYSPFLPCLRPWNESAPD